MLGQYTTSSRRAFLRSAALRIGSALALPLATRCAPPTAAEVPPTLTPSLPTPAPTQTYPRAATQTATPTPPLFTTRGKLVRAQASSFWEGDALSPDLLRQALDASLAEITGVQDAKKAWASLFKPTDRVAIKVNAISFGSTNPALVSVVTQRLMDLGIPAENITLYDRSSEELRDANFPLNASGSGIRCRQNEFDEQTGTVADQPVWLSKIVTECDALINMPVLKGFSIGGISFALKNHYGSMADPSRFHDARFAPGVTGLNALPAIKGKTRLIIGDILAKETHADWTDYAVLGNVNTLLVGFDPLTIDTVGLAMALEGLKAKGMNTRAIEAQVSGWLTAGEAHDLGVGELSRIDIKEVRI